MTNLPANMVEQSYPHDLDQDDVQGRIGEAFAMYRDNHPDYRVRLKQIGFEGSARDMEVTVYVPFLRKDVTVMVQNAPRVLKLSMSTAGISPVLVRPILEKIGAEVREWLA